MSSDSLVPPVLSPSSLYSEEARRDATRIRTYNTILGHIYNKVKVISKVPGGDKSIAYVIPEFIPGVPRFNMADAVLYIVWNLRNAGYIVNYTHPNFLYVSWKHYDARYRQNESPWNQVLVTARQQVLTGDTNNTIISSVVKPQAATVTPPDIQKRKTALKKTVEFKPEPDLIPRIGSNPSVTSAMYSSGQPTVVQKLPGQLTEKHVSFV